MAKVLKQCDSGSLVLGNISNRTALRRNLEQNAIPLEILDRNPMDYDEFLDKRRSAIALKLRHFYEGL